MKIYEKSFPFFETIFTIKNDNSRKTPISDTIVTRSPKIPIELMSKNGYK